MTPHARIERYAYLVPLTRERCEAAGEILGAEAQTWSVDPSLSTPLLDHALATRTAAELAALEQAVLTRREALWADCVARHAELDRCQAEYYRVHDARKKAAARERAAARQEVTP